jgi:exopolysaccharide biosynthesis predicted pyruvyltransferase EpsI
MTLNSIFQDNRDRPWIFLRNLGNWGDDLLFTGAEVLATRAGVKWTSYETPEFEKLKIPEDYCIYLQGGGGFNDWSSGRAFENLRHALARNVHLVVQGPMSVGGDLQWLTEKFAKSMQSINCHNFRIFAREHYTYEAFAELGIDNSSSIVHLDHDTALSLTRNDVLKLAELIEMPDGNYDLVVMREDPEQPSRTPASARSFPVTSGLIIDPAYEADSFRHWLRLHLFARSITTNRLHSSILGCIAGKRVALGPGSYHKNRSVWEQSLSENGAAWVEQLRAPRTRLWNYLPERLQDSYKLRQLRLAMYRAPRS